MTVVTVDHPTWILMKNRRENLRMYPKLPNPDRFTLAAKKEKVIWQNCMDEIHGLEMEAA
jgi:hypothetical protein